MWCPSTIFATVLTRLASLHKIADYFTDQFCLIDFDECFLISSPPPDSGTPECYLPPEVLLEMENGIESDISSDENYQCSHKYPISSACDLWALGCTLFEIRKQNKLLDDQEPLLADMVRLLGKPRWWNNWKTRKNFFTDE
ncbi:hypothetical protein N7495_000221 [Penicillium taxi]|uniref:uncharacterized protein n=1 Tax=Penicillium taxi TaxID=168475 RepID=UPI002545AE5B|nr:uncharacterized protein N7495_000221 [Penicillium taxi]KAJ5907539.1 hypothetical protein N7495_000221 [Penicillium taxi]